MFCLQQPRAKQALHSDQFIITKVMHLCTRYLFFYSSYTYHIFMDDPVDIFVLLHQGNICNFFLI